MISKIRQKLFLTKLIFIFLFFLFPIYNYEGQVLQASNGNCDYFVDNNFGSDSNNGTSLQAPWKSLSKVNEQTFQPGNVVCFKRGSTWIKEELTIHESGTPDDPITFTVHSQRI